MLLKLLITCVLVTITLGIHAAGFHMLIRAVVKSRALTKLGFWPANWLVFSVTCWLLLIHLGEIAVWGLFYSWQGCMPDGEAAFYFSAVTYTTVGYGDLVLPNAWRFLAPIEALTGILMCGLSTGIFFAIVSRRIDFWVKVKYEENQADRP
jgi:hypothetical protein